MEEEMTETAKAMMSDAEVMALHQAYIDKHKKAFRAAFDLLNRLWPPKNDAEWFKSTAIPDMTLTYNDCGDNRLAKELVMAVSGYVVDMAPVVRGEIGFSNIGTEDMKDG